MNHDQSQDPSRADGTVPAMVGLRIQLVIQGAPRCRDQWHDIETLRDGHYARRVFPARLIEYQRGDCASASDRFTEFRIVRREIIDREYQANTSLHQRETRP